jgi:peptide/nickel transport system substrate-binding protein
VRPDLPLAATLIALALLLSACAPAPDGGIRFAMAKEPGVLDPRLASDAASERVNALLYDRLVELDAAGRPQPGIATWSRLAPAHYRVQLLPGRASFWDGRPVQAADVAATYRSLLDPALVSPHAGALAGIVRIDVIDGDTVDFHLREPDPRFATRLTIGIVPASRTAKPGLAREPMGSGAFRFRGWRSDGGLLLERRADGQRVALLPVADPTMRVLKLMRGEADLLQNDLPAELYGYLDGRGDVALHAGPGTTFAYLGFNLDDPATGQRAVRQAIAHAIDREAIIRHLFRGRARPAESVLPPGHWAGADDLEPHVHDPARARALLAAAGYDAERPLRLTYKTSTDPFRVRIAHVLQQQLGDVGIELEIASYDWGTFFGDIKAGRFQMYSLAWVGVNSSDILRYAFHGESLPPAGANRGRYLDPATDRLIDTADAAHDVTAAAAYREVQHRVHGELVYVPLWYEDNVAVLRGVSGYRPGHDGNYLALQRVARGER